MRRAFPYGFTLPELLITLCLLAVVASFALPNLSNYLHSNRQENLRHSLLSHLKATRSDAITSARRAELCGSSNGVHCDHRWSDGWLIRAPTTNTLLRYSPHQSPDTLRWVGAGQTNHTVVYLANGTTASSNGRFILCSAEGLVVWQLVINRQGRVRQTVGLENSQSHNVLCG